MGAGGTGEEGGEVRGGVRDATDEHACGERKKTLTGSQLGRATSRESQWAAGPVPNAHAHSAHAGMDRLAVFSFLYFKKNKISKIYVRFEIFQKYTPIALP